MENLWDKLKLPLSCHAIAPLPIPGISLPCTPTTIFPTPLCIPSLQPSLLAVPPPPYSYTLPPPALDSSCRVCRQSYLSLSTPSIWLDLDRVGLEIPPSPTATEDNDVQCVREWWCETSQTLRSMATTLDSTKNSESISSDVEFSALIHMAPFFSYAAWTHPGLAKAAEECLRSLESGGGSPPGAKLVGKHAERLLEWARLSSTGGAWKSPSTSHVRHVIPWILSRLTPPCFSTPLLGLALPLALRLCDDWEATSVWCGLSALDLILRGATPTALAPWGALVQEALNRATACSGSSKHPTLILCLWCAKASANAAYFGRVSASTLPLTPLFKALGARRGKGNGGSLDSDWEGLNNNSGSPSLFEGPWGSSLSSLLRESSLTSGVNTLYAYLLALPSFLLWGGSCVSGPHFSHSILPLLLRALSPDTSRDARLPIAALHAVKVLAHTAYHSHSQSTQSLVQQRQQQLPPGCETHQPARDFRLESPLISLTLACIETYAAAKLSSNGHSPLLLPTELEYMGAPPAFPPLPCPSNVSLTLGLLRDYARLAVQGLKSASPPVFLELVRELRGVDANVDEFIDTL